MAFEGYSTGLVVGLGVVSFLPPILYVVAIRFLERAHREPWRGLMKAFLWGAFGGTTLAIIFEIALDSPPSAITELGMTQIAFAAIIVAPLVEEFAKGIGLKWIRDAHLELEDGIIYGATIGLGFAATENALYTLAALNEEGVAVAVSTVVLRTISSALLHAAATGLLGYAVWKRRLGQADMGTVVIFYVFAVVLHATFNTLAVTELLVAFLFTILLAMAVFAIQLQQIRRLDRRSATRPVP